MKTKSIISVIIACILTLSTTILNFAPTNRVYASRLVGAYFIKHFRGEYGTILAILFRTSAGIHC